MISTSFFFNMIYMFDQLDHEQEGPKDIYSLGTSLILLGLI